MVKSIYISIFINIYLIKTIDNTLVVKPSETVILRDQYKPFIALCTGEKNTRVGSWRSPSQIDIEENSHGRITAERKLSGLRLRIRNLTENDQGTWQCLGYDQHGHLISTNFHINVKLPITFHSESIQYAELDSTVLIKCRVNANPSAEISWFKGQNKIEIFSSNYQQTRDGLKINRVTSMDNDTFWCQADVIETGESKDYQIQVIIAKSITSVKITCSSPCAVEKRTATLICEANGLPTAQYSWSYGQDISLNVNALSKYIIRGNRLIINNIDQTDNGKYICHAFNDYDQIGQRTEYNLNVIIPPVVSSIAPVEIRIDEDFPRQRVSFSCRVERGSLDDLSIEWSYANNTSLQPINGISIDRSQRLSELIFDPVRREHHGNYTCLVKNAADTTSTIAQLFVQYKPIFLGPFINYIYSVPNNHITMKCQFDSYPSPIIQWRQSSDENNGVILEDNDVQVIQLSTKNIGPTIYETQLTYDPTEEDFDLKFECRADNSRIEKHLITLRRGKPPGEPQVPGVIPRSNSVQLNIKLPDDFGGLPLLEYVVKYEQPNVQNSQRNLSFQVLSNESQSIEIKSLRAASIYRIQVAVKSLAGQSAFSRPVQAQTLSGGAPQFSLSNDSCTNTTSCRIKWFIHSDGDSDILRGEILYAKIDSKSREKSWSKPIQINTNITEYELTGLKPNTNYSIILRLSNAAGARPQKIHKMTSSSSRSKKRPSSIGIVIGLIVFIIVVMIFVCIGFILCKARFAPHNRETNETSR